LLGAQHIIAELFAETADVRACVRHYFWDHAKLATSKSDKSKQGDSSDFKDYFQFEESVRTIPAHRILAINRGEKDNELSVKFVYDPEGAQRAALDRAPIPTGDPAAPAMGHGPEALAAHPHAEFLRTALLDALTRLIGPSLEREIRRELTSVAEEHAVHVFGRNLRSLLLAPPLRHRRVLAVDPAFKHGCKLAALDETGTPLEYAIIFPHTSAPKRAEGKLKLEELIRRHQTDVVAIGNGTACRETEEFVAELITELETRRNQPAAPAAA